MARGVVAAGYLITVVLQAPRYLFSNATGPLGILQVTQRQSVR
jgi:hypothetical protein